MEQTEQTLETGTTDTAVLARAAATSAGDVSVAVRAELARLLAANSGDRRKALPSGFDELVGRKAVSRSEATELAAIADLLFDGPDTNLAQRVRAYYRKLILDPGASPAALAIASVINSLLTPSTVSSGELKPQAVSKGNAIFGGFGAVVGAGIGAASAAPSARCRRRRRRSRRSLHRELISAGSHRRLPARLDQSGGSGSLERAQSLRHVM